MPRGGKRPGSGRKKGFAALSAEEARRVLSEMVAAEVRPIGEALIKKAKKGDVAAIRELFDRAWGRSQASTPESRQVQSQFVAINIHKPSQPRNLLA